MPTTITPEQQERASRRLLKLKDKHHVRRINARLYAVTSGRTGTEYLVNVERGDCSCVASLEFRKFCDHVASALIVHDALWSH